MLNGLLGSSHLAGRCVQRSARGSGHAPGERAFVLLRGLNPDSAAGRGSQTSAGAVLRARGHASPSAGAPLLLRPLDLLLPHSPRSLPRPSRETASAPPSNQPPC